MRHENGEGGSSATIATGPLVLPLAAVRAHQRSQVGGKAVALGEMLCAGLPVPPAFCVTTAAFSRFLMATDALAAVAALDTAPPGDALAKRGAMVRSRLAAAPMPVDLEEAIRSAWYGPLHGVHCAVRSSATAEDLRAASFAGQQDTVLNVRGAQALLRAVRQCWISLYSERALAYRQRHGLGHAGVRMAVVVQEFVPAEAAGVLFTVNPVSGRHDEALIEGSFGLGDAVVSARVTPDRVVVHKHTQHILQRTVSNKTRAVVPAGEDGVIEQPIAPEVADTAAFSDGVARRLTELGTAAERLFGAPQDIEWAVAGGEVFVLQARPITTPLAGSLDDRQVWTNMNTGEVLPDVVSPLTWSFLEHSLIRCFKDLLAQFGFDLNESPLVGRIGGRLYFNLNTLVAIGRTFPGGEGFDLATMLGGFQSATEARRGIAIAQQNLPRVKLSRLGLLRQLPRVIVWWLRHHATTTAECRLADFASRLAERQRLDLQALSESALVEELHRCAELLREVFTTLGGYALVGMSYFPYLHQACLRWLPNEPGAANQLITGVGEMSSAEAGLDMWRLAALAHRHAAVARTLLSGEEFAATRPALAAVDGGVDFLTHWEKFMARHGHHARGEIELMNQRWAENPDYVLAQVRSYLAHLGGKDPVALHRAQADEAARRAVGFRERLNHPAKRALFDYLVRRARRGVVYRENAKSELVRLLAWARQVALALGRRLHAHGVVEQPDDIFHLHLGELASACGVASATDLRALVRRRRGEFERNRSISPPPIVVGRLGASGVESEKVDTSTDRLDGLGVSPGVATGPARVILHVDDERVLPGEILVAPFTDPGWTPYFQLAAGLVTDLGGLLSHGSIVAREYGLPAVVNVGPATRIIHTGDQLQVDGTRGEVRILQRLKA